jgi:hypothetical protein
MDDDSVVNFAGLKLLGIPYCRTHICDRLEPHGLFPKSFKLFEHRNSPRLWWRREVVEWLKAKAKQPTAP